MRRAARLAFAGLLCLTAFRVVAADVEQRVAQLAAQVQAAEDVSAIKRLQRSYGYFIDKGLWTDLAEYFTTDAVANYPSGVFVGKASIREHLYRNVGGVPMGQVGLGENRLYNDMNIQPVVHLDPGGETAKGRWRAYAYFGSFGGAGGNWAEGVYEMQYRKEGGIWKISRLDYYSGFDVSYATGWVVPPATTAAASINGAAPATAPAPGPRRLLAHPADRERNHDCDGFPKACIAPFHYANPGTPEGGHVWTTVAPVAIKGDTRTVLADLALRAQRLRDEQQIENLQRIYGYYLDRAQWDQAADLFADTGTIEFAQQGLYIGRKRVREFLGTLGPAGLVPGWLNDHIQLQPIVTVSADGLSARIRSREFGMTGHAGQDAQWSEGIYENRLVKQNGVWKFSAVHYYPTFITDYDKGWTKDARPAPGPLAQLPPDRPPTERYRIFPQAHVPPFHYVNAVTGKPVTYPPTSAGGPSAKLAAAALMPRELAVPPAVRDVEATLAQAERNVARARDYDEIENLESAYGYYLDKNLWNPLADLFSRSGSIELAQRGVYKGPRLRDFLLKVFGRGVEGPVENRLGNHLSLQPVIDVAADGSTAKVRARMLQQMSQGGRASMDGAIYENELVKEDGLWKFSKVHAYNTFTANYDGGWARGLNRGMPGPAADFPPDAPPTASIAMLPIVYEIPYHYANPVSRRTVLASPPPLAAQLAQFPAPPPPAAPPVVAPAAQVAPASTTSATPAASASAGAGLVRVPAGMPANVAASLREIGAKVDGANTTPLYAPLHATLHHDGVEVLRDLAYGPHERHRADVFAAKGAPGELRPILVFVPGGGFTRGAKSTAGQFYYDNIGYWAAEHGLVGVTINYRLAPEFKYPAGAEDVDLTLQWLREHAAEFGGDSRRIFLWGHSAGAAHVATYLVTTKQTLVAGAILLSGIYDLGDKEVSIWKDYYGENIAQYAQRSTLARLAELPLPMLVAGGELDPPSFVPDTERLIAGRVASGKPTVPLYLPNHSHLSEAYAIGTADESLSGPILQFIKAPPR